MSQPSLCIGDAVSSDCPAQNVHKRVFSSVCRGGVELEVVKLPSHTRDSTHFSCDSSKGIVSESDQKQVENSTAARCTTSVAMSFGLHPVPWYAHSAIGIHCALPVHCTRESVYLASTP